MSTVEPQTATLEHELETARRRIEALRNMIVAIYGIAKAELEARRMLYDCTDAEIPDAVIRHEVQVLERFLVDAKTHVELIRQMEDGV